MKDLSCLRYSLHPTPSLWIRFLKIWGKFFFLPVKTSDKFDPSTFKKMLYACVCLICGKNWPWGLWVCRYAVDPGWWPRPQPRVSGYDLGPIPGESGYFSMLFPLLHCRLARTHSWLNSVFANHSFPINIKKF